MLSKANRLNLRTERARVEKEGHVSATSLFTLVYAANNNIPSRFAILTSKKLAAKSSQRNAIKRLITEGIRHETSKIPSGLDVIIIPKRTALEVSPETVKKEIVKQILSLYHD